MLDHASTPHTPLMQDPAFVQALRMCGQKPVTLPGGLTILQRRFAGLRVVMLPRASPPADLTAQLRHVGLHRSLIVLSPELPCRLGRSLRVMKPRTLSVLPLSGCAKSRRDALHPKWRNQLVRAEGHHLTVTRNRLDPDPKGMVLKLETAQSAARGYLNWPVALTSAFALTAPDQTHVFAASHRGESVAHMVFLTHGQSATYHIGHITNEGRHLCAHNLLLWRAASHFARSNVRDIDLGVLDGRTPGLDRFKRRAGGQPRRTGGTHLVWPGFTQPALAQA
ncbi:GNAT family N-acetyltransferase [Sulfitobacter noctilucicola]|nr:GNAT family N-acetyltransferase [Sulfitobacter noctilucicola]